MFTARYGLVPYIKRITLVFRSVISSISGNKQGKYVMDKKTILMYMSSLFVSRCAQNRV
jgi:hypothetical protein